MAFVHGKNAVFALRDATNTWRDMTPYTNEVTLPGKAGIAETSVFGLGAKTFIGGLLEGQLTTKGFFDSTATTGEDFVLAGLLGTQPDKGLTVVAQVTEQSNYGQFILFPGGYGSATNIAAIGDAVITDYSLSAPVNNVVSFTATFNLSGATPASDSMNGGTTTGAYGLQVIRAQTQYVLSTGWISGAGGAASYADLIGSTL
jgi:hypothetical protein